jgi:hypothetical protein
LINLRRFQQSKLQTYFSFRVFRPQVTDDHRPIFTRLEIVEFSLDEGLFVLSNYLQSVKFHNGLICCLNISIVLPNIEKVVIHETTGDDSTVKKSIGKYGF